MYVSPPCGTTSKFFGEFTVNNSCLKAEALWSVLNCHLRAVYFARCIESTQSKPAEISTGIPVGVLLVSTRTFKQVSFTDTQRITVGANLTTIGRVHIHHRNAFPLGLVLDKRLELSKSPTVQTGAHPFSRPNPLSDIYQVLQHNYACLLLNRLLDDLFAEFVIHMSHTTSFSARDFLQQLFCRLRTVGLKCASLCKKLISFMADLASATKLFGTCCKNVVFSQVDTQKILTWLKRRIGKVQNQIEVPSSFFTDQFPLFRNSLREVSPLERAKLQRHFDSLAQSVQGNRLAFNRIGPLIKMDASSLTKTNGRDGFVRKNGFGRVGFANRINRVADHLGAKRRSTTHFFIHKVMQISRYIPP